MGTPDRRPAALGNRTIISLSSREKHRQVEQKRLDATKNSKERNRSGQFATPFALACEIAHYIKDLWTPQTPVRLLEPSIGTGAFYSAMESVFSETEIYEAVGVEIDPPIADVARQLWNPTGLRVIQGDFTQVEPNSPGQFNLILANPPYVRHHHLSREQKNDLQKQVRRQTGYNIHGLAGLYCYFILLADKWLADDGLAVWLVPSEFMDVNYGEVIRRYLTEKVTLLHIHRARPDELQFEEALVSSAIVVYRKTTPTSERCVRFSLGGSLGSPESEQLITIDRLRNHRKWTQFSTAVANGKADHRNNMAPCLGDLFDIKRGIATGANGFFIMRRDEALRRGLPNVFLRPILPSSRYLVEPTIEAEDDGYPKLSEHYVLLDCSLPIEQIQVRYPTLYEYLIEGQSKRLDVRYLAKTRSPWYRQEQRAPAPFLCTYMGRASRTHAPFRFFWNRSQAIAPNVYLMLYPKEPLLSRIKDNPGVLPEILSGLMNIDFSLLVDEGRTYGGALHKIEPNELRHVRTPDFSEMFNLQKQFRLF